MRGRIDADRIAAAAARAGDPTPPPFTDATDPVIGVDDVPEPAAMPYSVEPEPAEPTAEEAAAAELTDAQVERSLMALLSTPYALVALRRGPHWRVTDAEVQPIAAALVPVVPRHWLVNRAVASSPWIAAGLQLYALTAARLEIDRQLQEETTDEPRTDGPGARSPGDTDRSRRGDGDRGDGAAAAADAVGGLTGDGMGL